MSKVDQKWKCIKFKSVQTLLKIACLVHTKSYVVIICAVPVHVKSWPKVKLGQVEVDSNIAKNYFHSSQEVVSARYFHMIACIIQPNKHSIWPLKVIQGQRSWGQLKDHMYMTYYMCLFHVNFGHSMHRSEDTAH